MIIPTPDFDPLFAEDGIPFRIKMLAYIRREFADLLGPLTMFDLHDDGSAGPGQGPHAQIFAPVATPPRDAA